MKSGYKQSHAYVDSLTVEAVGAGLSKYNRVFALGHRRKLIYQRAFKPLTGHESYKDSMGDIRFMTPRGIVDKEDRSIYEDAVDDGTNEENASKVEAAVADHQR